MPPDLSEAFAVLGLPSNSSVEAVNRAYKDLVRVWHPDRFSHDPSLQSRATERLKQINEAYEAIVASFGHSASRRSTAKAPPGSQTRRPAKPPKPPGPTPESTTTARSASQPSAPAPSRGQHVAGSFRVPLRVDRATALRSLISWLAAFKYAPISVFEPTLLSAIARLDLPYYSFSVQYTANYSASCGYYRTEHYTQYVTEYVNGRTRTVPQSATRVVTDWHPHSGVLTGSVTILRPDAMPAGFDFSRFLSDATFSTSEATGGPSADTTVFSYNRTPEQFYEAVVRAAVTSRVNSQAANSLPGNTYQHLSSSWHGTYNWWRIYLPYWHMNYSNGTHGINALVDGTDPSRVAGSLPTDVALKEGAARHLLPLWVALVTASLLSFSLQYVSVAIEWAIPIWLVAAGVGAYALTKRHRLLADARENRTIAVDRLLSTL